MYLVTGNQLAKNLTNVEDSSAVVVIRVVVMSIIVTRKVAGKLVHIISSIVLVGPALSIGFTLGLICNVNSDETVIVICLISLHFPQKVKRQHPKLSLEKTPVEKN